MSSGISVFSAVVSTLSVPTSTCLMAVSSGISVFSAVVSTLSVSSAISRREAESSDVRDALVFCCAARADWRVEISCSSWWSFWVWASRRCWVAESTLDGEDSTLDGIEFAPSTCLTAMSSGMSVFSAVVSTLSVAPSSSPMGVSCGILTFSPLVST